LLKTPIRSDKLKNRKKIRTKSNISSESASPDTLMERFIAMTSKHNILILERLTSFQDNALELMQERNEILRRLCNTLEQQSGDSSNDGTTPVTTNLKRYRAETGSESSENIDHSAPLERMSPPQARPSETVYQIPVVNTSSTVSTAVSTSGADEENTRHSRESILPHNIVDPESLQTLISQDSGITFHLDVPSNSSTSSDNDENHRRLLADHKSDIRLENITSDVNLSAFSSSLPPYFVSVLPDSTKKPRFTLSKSLTVPLHQGHRKIAPRK